MNGLFEDARFRQPLREDGQSLKTADAKEWGVRWIELVGPEGRQKVKEKIFTDKAAFDKFVVKVENGDNFYIFDSFTYPKADSNTVEEDSKAGGLKTADELDFDNMKILYPPEKVKEAQEYVNSLYGDNEKDFAETVMKYLLAGYLSGSVSRDDFALSPRDDLKIRGRLNSILADEFMIEEGGKSGSLKTADEDYPDALPDYVPEGEEEETKLWQPFYKDVKSQLEKAGFRARHSMPKAHYDYESWEVDGIGDEFVLSDLRTVGKDEEYVLTDEAENEIVIIKHADGTADASQFIEYIKNKTGGKKGKLRTADGLSINEALIKRIYGATSDYITEFTGIENSENIDLFRSAWGDWASNYDGKFVNLLDAIKTFLGEYELSVGDTAGIEEKILGVSGKSAGIKTAEGASLVDLFHQHKMGHISDETAMEAAISLFTGGAFDSVEEPKRSKIIKMQLDKVRGKRKHGSLGKVSNEAMREEYRAVRAMGVAPKIAMMLALSDCPSCLKSVLVAMEVKGKRSLPVGTPITVSINSGINSGKSGVVVSPTELRKDPWGRYINDVGVPQHINWDLEVAVRLDSGEVLTMDKDRLIVEGDKYRPSFAKEVEAGGDPEKSLPGMHEEQEWDDDGRGGVPPKEVKLVSLYDDDGNVVNKAGWANEGVGVFDMEGNPYPAGRDEKGELWADWVNEDNEVLNVEGEVIPGLKLGARHEYEDKLSFGAREILEDADFHIRWYPLGDTDEEEAHSEGQYIISTEDDPSVGIFGGQVGPEFKSVEELGNWLVKNRDRIYAALESREHDDLSGMDSLIGGLK